MTILDFLFPKRCVACKKLGYYLCPSCQKKIKFLTTNICPVCEQSSLHGMIHPGCETRYCLDGLYSACLYDGVIKKALHQFKYRPWLSDLGLTLSKILEIGLKSDQDNLILKFLTVDKPLIVPVPLHAKREKERGYNQSEIFAKLLAKKFKLSFCPDLLIRVKETKPQAKLKTDQRVKNIKNAFSISSLALDILISQYPNILLVDDIWTTGITLRTCGNLLKRKGSNKVWGLTLAR